MREAKPEGYYAQGRPEMLEFVPREARKVLDVGCGDGNFGAAVKQRTQAETWGIEPSPEAAAAAARRLDRVITGGIDESMSELPDGYFDCAIFNDVLEHLVDPYVTLEAIRPKLSASGVLVASIPNVLHVSVLRALLLEQDWRYEPFGVLDRTHLRFFTRKSIVEMFGAHGYEIEEIVGLNARRSRTFAFWNAVTLGRFSDARFLQFGVRARPRTGLNAVPWRRPA